ncbi:laminin subunit gamma-1-like [Lytechinus variegatus]|uniref:laminin subunit gamma-1-like n=1 Tax=Lytechinus variegatus TaxID=7654 RepID=UPI001BB265ED|nr:laminin subunit gamma-1-like [Lytechinus variegatus]
MLTRLNTFGDEVFRVPNVLRSYFYAITDFSIGGRCKCNGHASRCIEAPNDPDNRLVCQCEHNTAGPDCGECLPLYNDRKWRRATAGNANQCMRCNCNFHADRCFFDEDLFNRTGSGGHCMECRDDTAGVSCERCRDNYFRTSPDARCQPCNCDQTGSLNQQCDSAGRCQCKVGVGGDKCNQCLPNYYDFSEGGCRSCECVRAGSLDNNPDCNQGTGLCNCKLHVEGRDCETCKPGFFNLQESDEFGCLPCFCHGHSASCSSAPGYEIAYIESNFNTGLDGWKAERRGGGEELLVYNAIRQDIGIATVDNQPMYFVAPEEYLGNKLFSYGQELSFKLRLGSDDVGLSVEDLVLEGNGRQISAPLVAQGNPQPGVYPQKYTFKLRAEEDMGWVQRPSAFEFQSLLSNLTAIKIRATYSDRGQGLLDDVRLVSARRSVGPQGSRASFVELCSCPTGYVGQFCESCAAGYRRDPYGNGPFTRCIPCECNGHADYCDVDTGECICNHNTMGLSCELCQDGYYGNALEGTPYDCQPCPCPGGTNCFVDNLGEVVCTECPDGYVGNRCDYCADGFYGDPTGIQGERTACGQCYCNYNIDPNAVGNCDRFTGECLKCVFNTGGFYCENCLPGFYGNALGTPKGEQCQPCDCYAGGSTSNECEQTSGQCSCLPYVSGRDCSECYPGYWNIDSGRGCEPCYCESTGSTSDQCDIRTGQCPCKPGVTGQRCDECQYDHYDYSVTGCTPCECNPQGSLFSNCTDEGVCECRPGVIGDKCDSCEENFYNIALGCIPCPECYNLVRDNVNVHRLNLDALRDKINQISSNPTVINDTDFERRLRELEGLLNQTIDDAQRATAEDRTLADNLNAIKDDLGDLRDALARIRAKINEADGVTQDAKQDVAEAMAIIERLKRMLPDAQDYLDNEGWALLDRLRGLTANMSAQDRLMQEMAREATQLADNHTRMALMVEETSQEALEIAYQALEAARNSGTGGDLEAMVESVERNYVDAQELFNQASQAADECFDRAQRAAEEALRLLTKANMPLSPLDVNSLLEAANDHSYRAAGLIGEANDLRRENIQLLGQIADDAQRAAELLQQAEDAEKGIARLLAQADAARAIANEARMSAEQTLQEAKEILKTLQGFNEQIEQSKQEADDAKLRIPDIEAMIDRANMTAHNASDAISNAEGDAMAARNFARLAEENATAASEAARAVKTDAEATKLEAQEQKDRADDMKDDATELMMKLNATEAQAKEDGDMADLAQEKANAAKQVAGAAVQAAQNALDQLQMIKAELDGAGSIDLERLQDLEDDYLNINATILLDFRLDDTMNELRGYAAQQEGWISAYQFDLSEIRKEIANVEEIRDALPEFCPNESELEP